MMPIFTNKIFLKKGVIKWESILKMGVTRWEQNLKNNKGVIQWRRFENGVNVAAHTP